MIVLHIYRVLDLLGTGQEKGEEFCMLHALTIIKDMYSLFSSFSSDHSSVPSKKSSAGYQSGVYSPFASPRSDRHQSLDSNISRHKQPLCRPLEGGKLLSSSPVV